MTYHSRIGLATLGVMGLLTVGAMNLNIVTHAQGQRQAVSVIEAALVVGATPESLAAAGADGEDAAALFQSLSKASDERAALATKRAEEQAIRTELQSLKAVAQRGGMTDDRASRLGQLESQIKAAVLEREIAEEAIRAIIADGMTGRLGADSMVVFNRFSANGQRRIPAQYRALDLSADAWEALERAHIKAQRGVQLTAAEAATLNAAMSSSLVSTVSARLDANTDSIAQAIAVAMAE